MTATRVKIFNVNLTLADTEVSFKFPTDTRSFMIQNRGSFDVKISDESGQSGTKFFTLFTDSTIDEKNLKFDNETLFFQSAEAAQVLEIFVTV